MVPLVTIFTRLIAVKGILCFAPVICPPERQISFSFKLKAMGISKLSMLLGNSAPSLFLANASKSVLVSAILCPLPFAFVSVSKSGRLIFFPWRSLKIREYSILELQYRMGRIAPTSEKERLNGFFPSTEIPSFVMLNFRPPSSNTAVRSPKTLLIAFPPNLILHIP